MAETVLYSRTSEIRSQASSEHTLSHINAALLKKPHNYDMLCCEIEDIQQVMECLLQKEIISNEESREVISIVRRGRRVAKLLEILFTKPTGQWIDKFLEILEVTDQSHVINRLTTRTPPCVPCESSCKSQDYILNISPKDCSECFRQTVVECFQNLIDEIETKMIQKTFDRNDSAVPEFIQEACIYEKEKRSRKERAEIFLRFILGHEQLLMDFKTIFNETSTFSLPQVPCEAHGGDYMGKCHLREKTVFHFEIHYDRLENTVIVNSVSRSIDKHLKFATEDDLACLKFQQCMLKLSGADSGDIQGNGYLVSQCHESDTKKTSFQRWLCGYISKLHLQRLAAIRDFRHRFLHSPLSVSPDDLQVYQENYRLTLLDLEANDSKSIGENEVVDFRKIFYNTQDKLTTLFMEIMIECDFDSIMDSTLRCIQDTMQSTCLDEHMKGLDETRIVLIGDSIGKTGIANQLLNNCNLSGNGSEKEPKRGTYNDLYFKKKIVVTSAPKMQFDSRETMDVIKQIQKAMLMTAPGPHAFIIVVDTSQVDVAQLNETIQYIMHYFGESTLQYTMVTAIEDVQKDRKFMNNIESSPNIKDIVQKGRIVYMKDEKPCNRNILVESVLRIIEQTAKTMGQDHFTSKNYEKVEEFVMKKTHDLCTLYQEEYKRHEIAKASLKAKMTPYQILMKRMENSDLREDVIQNVDEFDVEIDFL